MYSGANPDNSSTKERICFAPNAQLIPILRSGKCDTDIQYASTVCPERVRPLLSVIVKDTITGTRRLGAVPLRLAPLSPPKSCPDAYGTGSIPRSSNNRL